MKIKNIKLMGLSVGMVVTLLVTLIVGAFFGAIYFATPTVQLTILGIFIPVFVLLAGGMVLYIILISFGVIK